MSSSTRPSTMPALQFDLAPGRLVKSKLRGLLRSSGYWKPGGAVGIRAVPTPALVAEDWVVVKTVLSGICGSDMKELTLDGALDNPLQSFLTFPHTMGHEVVGIVDEAGAEVTRVKRGDRVAVNPWLSCAPRGIEPVCPRCQAGDSTHCRNFQRGRLPTGMHLGVTGPFGGFAPYVAAHESQCFVIPEGVGFEAAVPADPFSVALHACLALDPDPHTLVLVTGLGIIGLAAVLCLKRLFDVKRVVAVGRYPVQKEWATRFGAELVFGGQGAKLVEEVAALAGAELYQPDRGSKWSMDGVGGIVDTIGSAASIEAGMRFLATQGRLVFCGVSKPQRCENTPHYFKELEVIGSNAFGIECYRGRKAHAFELFLEFLAVKRIDTAPLVTHKFPLDQYREAFDVLADKKGSGAVKVVFDFRWEGAGGIAGQRSRERNEQDAVPAPGRGWTARWEAPGRLTAAPLAGGRTMTTSMQGASMRGKKGASLALLVWLAILLRASVALALLTDEKNGQWSLLGKIKLQTSVRTTDTPPNNPIPIEAGDVTSQRNLLLLEFKQDLGLVKPWLQLGYYLEGRFFYDGVWDYGPGIFSDDDVRAYYLYDNRHQINDLKWDADLYMGYVDLTSGPAFLRVGRQVLSWGEMSTFRVLDGINPLNNSTLAVDLLERMVPLGMLRGSLAFDNVGPFSSLSFQAYYVNGNVDNASGEDLIDGSAIYPPVGRDTVEDLENPFSLASLKQNVRQVPDDEIDDDRFGAKFGLLWEGLNLNLAYYRMYSDTPVPLVDSSSFDPVHLAWEDLATIDTKNPIGWLFGGQKLDVLLKLDTVDVAGGSFNYNWEWIDTVLRGEIAYQMDVPKMTPGSIKDMLVEVGGKIFLPGGASLADLLADVPLEGGPVLPFSTGQLDKFDILKYGFALDKWIRVPALSRADFLVMLEYVGSTNLDWREKTIVIPWQSPEGKTLYETKYSNTFFLITQTNYMAGNLTPQLVMIYEVEPQAISCIPAVKYQWRNFEFDASYMFTFSASYVGTTGMLESRDEISFSVGYNF